MVQSILWQEYAGDAGDIEGKFGVLFPLIQAIIQNWEMKYTCSFIIFRMCICVSVYKYEIFKHTNMGES